MKNLLIFLILLTVTLNLKANEHVNLDEIYRTFKEGKYNQAEIQLNEIEKEIKSTNNDTLSLLFNFLKAESQFFQNKYTQCIPYFIESINLFEKINLRENDYLESYLALGVANQKIKNYKEAEKNYRKGLLKTVVIPESTYYRSSFFLNLGNLFAEQGFDEISKECYKRIDTKDPYTLIDGSIDEEELFDDSEMEAIELRKQGDYIGALEIYDKLIPDFKEKFGAFNDDYARLVYSKLIVLGINLGEIDEAIPLCEEVINLKDLIPYSENITGSYGKLMQYLAYKGDEERIYNILPDAIEYINLGPDKEKEIPLLYRIIGNGAYWNQNYSLAIPFYEKYLSLDYKEPGNSYLEIPNMLAVAYLNTNEILKAKGVLEHLIKKFSKELNQNLEIKSLILHNYGRSLMLLGKRKDAIKYFQESNLIYTKLYGEANPKTINYLKECETL